CSSGLAFVRAGRNKLSLSCSTRLHELKRHMRTPFAAMDQARLRRTKMERKGARQSIYSFDGRSTTLLPCFHLASAYNGRPQAAMPNENKAAGRGPTRSVRAAQRAK